LRGSRCGYRIQARDGAKAMRGSDAMQEALLTVAKLEALVPANHPLRAIRDLVNEALGRFNGLLR
jgi:hypothetical protein